MNRYSILRFGSTFEFVERELTREGYVCEFSCMSELNRSSSGGITRFYPDDFDYRGNESGWEMRRKIKAWAVSHDFRDYRIVRNTGYCKDLHGVVYELWVRRKEQVRKLIDKWVAQGKDIDEEMFKQVKCLANGGLRDTDDPLWDNTAWVKLAALKAGYNIHVMPWKLAKVHR